MQRAGANAGGSWVPRLPVSRLLRSEVPVDGGWSNVAVNEEDGES